MSLEKKKILVTGAGGFIGSHLAETLCARNCRQVRAFLHYNSQNNWGNIELLPKTIKKNLDIVLGDLRDPLSVKKVVKGIDVVFHLGALISIPYSYQAPQSFFDTNATGSLHVFQAALDEGVEKVIHTSTSEVYGTARYIPIDENHPLQGQSPYSASKIAADKIAESFYRSFDLPVIIIRPFNTYGPRQSARAIVMTILAQILQKKKAEIKLGSLHPIRDLNFVEDTVNGFLAAAQSLKSIGEVINIGSGRGISIKELAEVIIRLFNPEAKILVQKARIRPEKSEVDRLVCDNKKAKDMLNWKSCISLEEGLQRTKDYLKANFKRYKTEIYHI